MATLTVPHDAALKLVKVDHVEDRRYGIRKDVGCMVVQKVQARLRGTEMLKKAESTRRKAR